MDLRGEDDLMDKEVLNKLGWGAIERAIKVPREC